MIGVVIVVGAGFAGVEAAWALGERGIQVRLYEMRPNRMTPAHTTSHFAELVCSNSLKSKLPDSPAGQLKAEMQALGSLVLRTAYEHEVPAGQALGVDREAFGEAITRAVEAHPMIDVLREDFTRDLLEAAIAEPDTQAVILATGPLTSPELAQWLATATGREHLYFYDAVSPTVDASTIDMSIAFSQSRYDKGEGDDYINCPFNKDEYDAFVAALVSAERAPFHAFEAGGVRGEATAAEGYDSASTSEEALLKNIKYFAGCMPIEAIADRGADSLRFGNFKPVGLTDPRTGRRPWAAIQLRPENREKTLYSLVACQNRLRFGEQKRVFQMVPGLQNAEFVRYGVIHRNTYLEAPRCLTHELELRACPKVFVAGQLTGVEGYVESAAMGIYAGLAVAHRIHGKAMPVPERASAYGSLLSHLQDQTEREFAPMNINWGLFPDPEPFIKNKGDRKLAKIAAARTSFQRWLEALDQWISLSPSIS
jgi:methylenetetrahydrofolate--tRNA-(uracil-5-)-methyltransferase